jgi:hypothetical protein
MRRLMMTHEKTQAMKSKQTPRLIMKTSQLPILIAAALAITSAHAQEFKARLYGPLEPYYERSWALPDIEKVK